jgi:hypothetical protein
MFVWCPTDNKAYILSIISLSICLFLLQLKVVLSILLRPLIVCLKTQHVFGVIDTENSNSILKAYDSRVLTIVGDYQSSYRVRYWTVKDTQKLSRHTSTFWHVFICIHTYSHIPCLAHTYSPYKCIIAHSQAFGRTKIHTTNTTVRCSAIDLKCMLLKTRTYSHKLTYFHERLLMFKNVHAYLHKHAYIFSLSLSLALSLSYTDTHSCSRINWRFMVNTDSHN